MGLVARLPIRRLSGVAFDTEGVMPRRVGKGQHLMRTIGRLGQWIGLALPAVAVMLELGRRISLGQMLMLLVFSVCCFWIGRIVEGYGGR